MKTIGSLLLIFAGLNFLVTIYAACIGEFYEAGNKLSSTIIVGLIGGILYYFGAKKKEGTTSLQSNKSTIKEDNPKESFWQTYKHLHSTNAAAIENLTGKNCSLLSDKNAKELVGSMERWAENLNCPIQDLKKRFLETYDSVFDSSDTKEIIEHLKNEKMEEEASHFNISSYNTCAFYMIRWLKEAMHQTKNENKQSLEATNQMSAKELISKENAKIEFHDFEDKNGKKHKAFTCGSITGYVSPNAIKEVESNLNYLDNLVYTEVSKDGRPPIPCLMIKSKKVVNLTINKEYDIENGQENPDNTTANKKSNPSLVYSNRMSAKEFIKKQNAELEYHDFDGKDGKHHTFFVCGSITGYVSPNAKYELEKKECDLDNLYYAEVSKDGGEPVPCLLRKPDEILKPKKTFSPKDIEDEETKESECNVFPPAIEKSNPTIEQEIRKKITETFEQGICEAKQLVTENHLVSPFDTLVIKSEIGSLYEVMKNDTELKSKCIMAGANYIEILNEISTKYYNSISPDGSTIEKPTFIEVEETLEKGFGFNVEGKSKETEIRNQLTYLMIEFIQSIYGDIKVTKENINNPNILSTPLTNAEIFYEDNKSMIETCNNYGIDYQKVLFDASQQVIKYYLNKDNPSYNDLPI